MRRLVFACGLSLLGVGLALPLVAQSEYWVAVESYKDMAAAERAREIASARLRETFSIAEVDTAAGRYLRVMAGPYISRDIADHMLSEAQRNGFGTAWILMTDRDGRTRVLGPSLSGYEPSLMEVTAPPADARPIDSPRVNEPEGTPLEERPLIEEAPPGYTLHRLHRDPD